MITRSLTLLQEHRSARTMTAMLLVFLLLWNVRPAKAQGHHEPLFHYSRVELGWSRPGSGAEAWEMEAAGWAGSDLNRLWWNATGELHAGEEFQGDIAVLYGRYVRTFWDVVVGYRREFGNIDADAFVFGISGLAPYWFEVSALAFVRSGLNPGFQLAVDTDWFITQKLIVRPEVRIDLSATSDAPRGVRSGLETFEGGFRTRYEFSRKFAPYLDVRYVDERGGSAALTRNSSHNFRFGGGIQIIF